jgi:RNA-directed DNA polymerase
LARRPLEFLKTVDDLAAAIGSTPRELHGLAARIDALYVEDEVDGRLIRKPRSPLKDIQRRILRSVLIRVTPSEIAHGCVRGRSPESAAAPHLGSKGIAKADITSFFPSIHMTRVARTLRDLGCEPEVVSLITRLTTFKGSLPQGAPTSPMLSILATDGLLNETASLARRFDVKVTSFVDDFTFSGKAAWHACEAFVRALERRGFKSRPEKRLSYPSQNVAPIVTGLVVTNATLTIPRHKVREIIQLVRLCRANVADGQFPSRSELFSLHGKLDRLARFRPELAKQLREHVPKRPKGTGDKSGAWDLLWRSTLNERT